MKYSLIIYRREPAVERTLDFSAKFVASFVEKGEEKKDDKNETEEELSADEEGEEMHPLVMKFFNFLLEVSGLAVTLGSSFLPGLNSR